MLGSDEEEEEGHLGFELSPTRSPLAAGPLAECRLTACTCWFRFTINMAILVSICHQRAFHAPQGPSLKVVLAFATGRADRGELAWFRRVESALVKKRNLVSMLSPTRSRLAAEPLAEGGGGAIDLSVAEGRLTAHTVAIFVSMCKQGAFALLTNRNQHGALPTNRNQHGVLLTNRNMVSAGPLAEVGGGAPRAAMLLSIRD